MNKSMCITYEVQDGLYLNITNRCTNACSFCIRNNGDGAYGSDSLWLEHEPSTEEILCSVFARDLSKYSEIVFCGYGEPTLRFDTAKEVAAKIKEKFPNVKIRINTNGHSDLICGRNTAPEYADLFDTVSISLNAPTAEKYNEICHPVYKEKAFAAVVEFANNVNKYVQKTILSVVSDFIDENEIEQCKKIAEAAGVSLKVRAYEGK